MRSAFVLLALGTAMAGIASATTAPPVKPVERLRPEIGSFGFDTSGMDKAVAPGDDFYRFASGSWARTTPIPPDRSDYGLFTKLEDLSFQRTRGLLEAEVKKPASKLGLLYASFMDETTVEARGIDPARPELAAALAVPDRSAFAAALGDGLRRGVVAPIWVSVQPDSKDPDVAVVEMGQSGLGLPDRDYYLKTDANLVAARTAYLAYLTNLFAMAGEADGAARAKAILGFETQLAQVQWTRIDNRDSDKTYNVWARDAFAKQAPGFDWTAFLAAAGLNGAGNKFIVDQPSAIAGSARIVAATPMTVLRDYLWARTLDHAAPYLSRRFVDAHFAYHGTALSGTPQLRERWKRGVDLIKGSMGEAAGQLYVARYFPPETKAAADTLVRNLIAAWDQRLQALGWMAPETKAKARAKLATFTPKIGYPTKWRDYAALEIRRGDLFGNVERASRFDWQRNLTKLGKPIDRGEWFMTPMEINAYANPVWNEVVFPAAILQPPFFDPHADPAVNYGGIGAVIGHELSHHFDDQGRKYDMHGRLAEWWTPADVSRFTALTDRLVAQYDAYQPFPGAHVQGRLTLGENIADLAGLTVAYQAYHLALKGTPAPVIDGYSGDQRFYLGWAQIWRRSYREANLRQRLLTDPHAPAEQRVATIRNLDPWYAAFKPKPGEMLSLAPKDRVRIW